MVEYKKLNSDVGLTCTIYYDDDCHNPRKDWDNLAKIVVPETERYLDNEYDLGLTWDDREEDEKILNSHEVYMWLPLYRYEHSGVAYSTGSFGDPWDSGQVGYMVILRKDAEENWGTKDIDNERIRGYAKAGIEGEVETLSQWANGEIYGFIITDDDTDEEIDSCWGFYGDDGLEEIEEGYFQPYVEEREEEEREEFERENALFIACGINPLTIGA